MAHVSKRGPGHKKQHPFILAPSSLVPPSNSHESHEIPPTGDDKRPCSLALSLSCAPTCTIHRTRKRGPARESGLAVCSVCHPRRRLFSAAVVVWRQRGRRSSWSHLRSSASDQRCRPSIVARYWLVVEYGVIWFCLVSTACCVLFVPYLPFSDLYLTQDFTTCQVPAPPAYPLSLTLTLSLFSGSQGGETNKWATTWWDLQETDCAEYSLRIGWVPGLVVPLAGIPCLRLKPG